MTDYTLHCFLESGNSYKPALMLELCGADWQPQWVDFIKSQEHRSPKFLALNPMGEVPVLIDHAEGDMVITQSGVMLWYLARKLRRFSSQNEAEEREILRWILFDNHKLTGMIAPYRFLNKFMDKGNSPEGRFLQGRMVASIKTLNRHLEDCDWVAADRPTIADLSLVGYLYWPDHFGVTWSDYPNIDAWLKRIVALPNYRTPEDILPSGPAA